MSQQKPGSASHIPSSVGQAACGIVHDLANLIQTIILRAEVTATTEPVSAACIRRMEQIVDDGQGGANLVRSLLEYARKAVDSLAPVDLHSVVPGIMAEHAGASGLAVTASYDETPLPAKVDSVQLADLIRMVFSELSTDASTDARYEFSLSHAKPFGDALSWMAEEQWAEIQLTRLGDGPQVDLEEGHDYKIAGANPPDEHLMNLMRIRGIVRQHRGQLRTREEVEDASHSYIVEIFLPLA